MAVYELRCLPVAAPETRQTACVVIRARDGWGAAVANILDCKYWLDDEAVECVV